MEILEQIKAEVERLNKTDGFCQNNNETADIYYSRGVRFACNTILGLISNLQEKSEKPSVGLEEEVDKRWKEWISEDKDQVEGVLPKSEFAFYARHFAQWQKEQMMKGAKDGYVSGIIIHNDGDEEHYAVTYPNGERPHSITDKVKIIIL